MGWIDDLYKLIDDETPAMEASDDITGEVNAQSEKVLGRNNDVGDDNNGEIDLNTNDILGTKGDAPNTENTDDTSEDPSISSDNEDENSNDQQSTNIPDEPSDPQTPEDIMNDKDDPFSSSRKKKLWKNFKTFYESLGDSAKLIAQYVPNTSDANTIRALDNIRDNLAEARDMVYDILTKEYPTMSYPELQKRYIALNHIYDLCTQELETYFEKYHNK